MASRVLLSLLFMMTVAGAGASAAQDAGRCPAATAPADTAGRRADVVLRASARAAEVRFESRPEIDVRLNGCAALDSLRVVERRNLPRPVQPGVTYRDVSVAVEIRSYLSVECLLGSRGASGAAIDSARVRAAPDLARLCSAAAADPTAGPPPRR